MRSNYKQHPDSFLWMRYSPSSLYAHGTFLTPATLSCLLSEEKLSLQSTGRNQQHTLSSYLEFFAHQTQHGVSQQNSPNSKNNLFQHTCGPCLVVEEPKVNCFYECLNRFLDSLPFEYFFIPMPNNAVVADDLRGTDSIHSKGQKDMQSSDSNQQKSLIRRQTVLRLPFPGTVPLEAIKIPEPVELPGCDGILFPDVKNSGHQYSVSEENVKRQIQKSMACKRMKQMKRTW